MAFTVSGLIGILFWSQIPENMTSNHHLSFPSQTKLSPPHTPLGSRRESGDPWWAPVCLCHLRVSLVGSFGGTKSGIPVSFPRIRYGRHGMLTTFPPLTQGIRRTSVGPSLTLSHKVKVVGVVLGARIGTPVSFLEFVTRGNRFLLTYPSSRHLFGLSP